MGLPLAVPELSAVDAFSAWLDELAAAFRHRNAETFGELFADDGFWKDMLAFSWDYRTFSGRSEIDRAFAAYAPVAKPFALTLAAKRTLPRFTKRGGREVIEGFFDFQTVEGAGTGYARLLRDRSGTSDTPVWLLLTTLQVLDGFEEAVGDRRPTGNEFAKNTVQGNWLDRRRTDAAFADRNPEVLIVGGGHSGLSLAARFRHMGVDALVIEKMPRIGDVWRNRYHSLTLHNQVFANHMPYMPFPETWHTWLPKDKLAGWLESYADILELNVWRETELLDASYDATAKRWTARLRCGDGTERVVSCRHLVMATGVSGSIPKRPKLPGIEAFAGQVIHSSEFSTGECYRGRRAVVVGTGNSGHDVAQDLQVNGAEKVWMLQRGPSCVVSLEPTATSIYAVYAEGLPVEDVDLATAAVPYPVLRETYQWLTRKARSVDADLTADLNTRGFETFYGRDDTGFHMMYLRGEGGYYIDVGCSDLIRSGEIGVLQTRDMDRFVGEGIRMTDGGVVPCDLVVLATGFDNMQENVRRMLGDDVADRVGPIWGFDEDHAMRNMWRPTAQEGFWVMGGGLIDARLFSRFLALQIAAALAGGIAPRPRIATKFGDPFAA